MKKLIRWAACAAMVVAFALPMAACNTHEHKWSDWQRSETEHWRTCSTCGEEERSAHSTNEGACTSCGYGFRAIGIGFVEGGDGAHADFAVEANEWFAAQGKELGFSYEHKTDCSWMTSETLADYDLVILLNNKPNGTQAQAAFRNWMEKGGACLAFHSSAFAMWNGAEPSDWENWYQNELLGCGEYGKPADPNDPNSISYWNTWNPTAEPMRIETYDHYATKGLLDFELENDEFMSAPCEWYEWQNDLFSNPDIDVLLTLNPTEENPAGDDPRAGMEFQIWKSGCHPIAWASKKYNMLYTNMGHNLMSYNNFEKTSRTFSSEAQNRFILDSMFGLVQNSK